MEQAMMVSRQPRRRRAAVEWAQEGAVAESARRRKNLPFNGSINRQSSAIQEKNLPTRGKEPTNVCIGLKATVKLPQKKAALQALKLQRDKLTSKIEKTRKVDMGEKMPWELKKY